MCNDTSIYFSSSLYLSISSIVVHKTTEYLMKENVVVLFLKLKLKLKKKSRYRVWAWS